MAYLFFRDSSRLGGKFNPTNKENYSITNNHLLRSSLERFCRDIVKMDGGDFQTFLRKGDVMAFKRTVKNKKSRGVPVQLDPAYVRLKTKLKIEPF